MDQSYQLLLANQCMPNFFILIDFKILGDKLIFLDRHLNWRWVHKRACKICSSARFKHQFCSKIPVL